MIASFSIVPIGKAESLGKQVASVIATIRESGLDYQLGPMSTVVEGSPDEVFDLIKKCHTQAKNNCSRIYTNITIDDRSGFDSGRIDGKVKSVQEHLTP